MTRLILRALAFRDLDAHATYLQANDPKVAVRFHDATDGTLSFLAKAPEVGRLWDSLNPELARVRVWRIRGFSKYLIFYQPTGDTIEVVRVLHASQNIDAILAEGR